MPEEKRARLELIQQWALYRDPRFGSADAICLLEVIEHVDPPRPPQLARVVFGSARPRPVALTTPKGAASTSACSACSRSGACRSTRGPDHDMVVSFAG